MTRADVFDQSISLSTIVAYLAIYLGFVLVIACAAILAIQQLSDASDNAQRYGLLRKLGAPERMIDGALFVQVLVYFLVPLAVAVCHTCSRCCWLWRTPRARSWWSPTSWPCSGTSTSPRWRSPAPERSSRCTASTSP